MTLNIIVGEKILIYNCCFDNLIAAVTDHIYIYMTRRKKHHSLFLYRAHSLPSLLFLSTDTNNWSKSK